MLAVSINLTAPFYLKESIQTHLQGQEAEIGCSLLSVGCHAFVFQRVAGGTTILVKAYHLPQWWMTD